jgi:hypothetical protein
MEMEIGGSLGLALATRLLLGLKGFGVGEEE